MFLSKAKMKNTDKIKKTTIYQNVLLFTRKSLNYTFCTSYVTHTYNAQLSLFYESTLSGYTDLFATCINKA